jgi:UPF0042 nucleotide-binding protein
MSQDERSTQAGAQDGPASRPESAQAAPDETNDLVIVTGMSGAGRTEAMHAFEDMGYYCIDNLPAKLISALIDVSEDEPSAQRLAVVCDTRNKAFFGDLQDELEKLRKRDVRVHILFLDADDDKLVARYKASRRRHPLCEEGMTIAQGISAERAMLMGLRNQAQDVVDTTDLLPMQLRKRIRDLYADAGEREGLSVTVYSFGFKHGAALDADIVIDVRFLPNPYYDPALRPLCGLDAPVRDYVMYRDETIEFMNKWKDLLDIVMPGYVKEGKQQLAIAVGCTGGQHRSVAIAEATGDHLRTRGYRVSVTHRDLALADTVRKELTGADHGA